MDYDSTRYDDVALAMQQINSLLKVKPGIDIFDKTLGEHLNPGDVYDAYEAIPKKPTAQHVLCESECGPFAAIFLYRHPEANSDNWLDFVVQTFHSQYVKGFINGFQLNIPDETPVDDVYYLRGVYDGVMANAAVY